MALLASLRSTIAYQTTGSTISTGAIYQTVSGGAPVWSNALVSSMVSIGASTNQVYTTLSQGNFVSSVSTSSWVSSLTNRVSTTTVAMSANAQYQLALSQSSISTSVMFTSTLGTSPSAWSTLSGATGLPNYSTISYTAGAISGDGRYGLLGTNTGNLYTTANSGQSWTNTASTVPYSYFRFDNSLADVQGNTTLTATGTIGYVTGNVGTHALSISNTAGGGSTNYVRGPITIGNRFTIACWINFVILPTTDAKYSQIIAFGNSSQNLLTINYYYGAQFTGLYIQYNNSSNDLNSILGRYTVTTNTWYNIRVVFQGNSISYVYINNALVAIATTTNVFTPITQVTLGGDNPISATGGGFNGYIDDLRIFNTAITVDGTINWSSTAVSNTGQYMLATVTNGGLYMSSNFGLTWTLVTGAMLSALWSNAQVSATGQYMLVNAQPQIVQPQLTGLPSSGTALTTSPWQANGITWTASASSVYNSTFPVSNAFNNSFATLNGWVSSITSTYNSSGAYIGTTSTNIVNGSGAVLGEWLQIQSSVPLQMYSYNFASGNTANIVPKVYYIVGSNDNVNWYIIQTVNLGATCPFTAINIAATSSPIIINQSGSQTMNGGNAVTFTPGTAATSTSAFIYFRLIVNSVFGTSLATELGEWFINFQAGGQTYSTNYGSTWLSGLPLYTIIQPQLAGISTTTWQTNGNTWISSASTTQGGTTASYLAFNNTLGGNNTWASAGTYTAGTGVYTGSVSTPNIVGTGTYTGEWLQIQSSSPIVMNSYSFANGGNTNGNQAPRIYQIVGSNDGSTWYTIQTVTVTGNPYAAVNTYANTIIVNSPGTFAGSNGSSYAVTTTTFTTGAYLYFRLCVNATIPESFGAAELGEWVINFTSSIQTSQALSESGQYALNSYIPGTIVPQQTGLTTNTWNQGGVGWTASASSSYTSNFPPWATFNNANSATGIYSWASAFNYTSGVYIGSVTTPITGIIPNPMPGEWLQIQSSIPLVMHSYNFGAGNSVNIPKNYYIVGSNDGITWAPIQYVTMGATNPFTNNNSSNAISSNIIVNQSGTQMMNGGNSATLTCTIYPSSTTTAYNYFRIIANVTFGPGIGVFELAEWFLTFTGPTNTSLYNVVSPLTGFSTGAFVTSGTIPGAITNSAISNTGQYMVVITNNTSGNNVYYSMNYGSTFTGLQLGTSVLTSCAMSYDGSYITIASGATVYTLNNNSTGFSVALGNQAGYQNQANNAIAIGNYAGYQNQTANSIILNASGPGALGIGLNSYAQGFYVAPIASYTASSSQTFALLGYGTDNQVVQTNSSVIVSLSSLGVAMTGIASTYFNTTGIQTNGGIFLTGDPVTAAQWQMALIGNYRLGFNVNNTGIDGYSANYTTVVSFDNGGLIYANGLRIPGAPGQIPATGQLITYGTSITLNGSTQGANYAGGGTSHYIIVNANDSVAGFNSAVAGQSYYGQSLSVQAGSIWANDYNGANNPLIKGGTLYLTAGNGPINGSTNNGTGVCNHRGGDVAISAGVTNLGDTISGSSSNISAGDIKFLWTPCHTWVQGTTQPVQTAMIVEGRTGNVGIGVTNPAYPLTVYGGTGLVYNVSGNNPYLSSPSLVINNVTTGYGAVCAWFQKDVIAGGAIGSFSDIRIKNKIEHITNALEKINNIPIVQHDYVDKVKYPRACSVGVIAQDIVSIIPDAVRYEKEFIPNIMQIPSQCIRIEDYIKITCDIPMDISISDTLKLVLLSEEKQVSLLYLSPDKRTIHVPAWNDDHLDQLFVYGKQIDDFHIIDKAKLGILALGGVKELYQLLMKQQSQITDLIAQVKLLTDNK